MVNSIQAEMKRTSGHYVELQGVHVPVPNGVTIHFVEDADAYSLSLADQLDPCSYTVSSDERGVIVEGFPLGSF
jgi:hypothetical protein